MTTFAEAAEGPAFFWAFCRAGAGIEGAANGGKSWGNERPGGTEVGTGVDFLDRGPVGGNTSAGLGVCILSRFVEGAGGMLIGLIFEVSAI